MPSCVSISLFDDANHLSRWDTVGIVLYSDQKYSVVVGLLRPLQPSSSSDPAEIGNLLKGKVVVIPADITVPESSCSIRHPSDIATVVMVDFQFGLFFLKFKNPFGAKGAQQHGLLGSFKSILESKSKRMICLEFRSSPVNFVPMVYDLDLEGGVECTETYGHDHHRYLHVDCTYHPAVIINQDAQIVGFKIWGCPLRNHLAHIVQIDHLQALFNATLSLPDRDIQFPSPAENDEQSPVLCKKRAITPASTPVLDSFNHVTHLAFAPTDSVISPYLVKISEHDRAQSQKIAELTQANSELIQELERARACLHDAKGKEDLLQQKVDDLQNYSVRVNMRNLTERDEGAVQYMIPGAQ